MVHSIKLNQPQFCPHNFLLERRRNSVGISLHLTGISASFKAQKILLGVIFQHFLQNFAHVSAPWKTQTQQFYLRGQEEPRKKYLKFILAIQQACLVLVCKIPLWLNFTKRNRFEAILLVRDQQGHGTGKRLCSHAQTGKAKCGGVPSCMKCSSSWLFQW